MFLLVGFVISFGQNETIEEDGEMITRNKKGKFMSIPDPVFSDGEIVTTSDKHYSPKALTILTKPTYSENRGWVYIENYVDLQHNRGGAGMWNNEDLYKKIADPVLKLYAERIKLKTEIKDCELGLKIKRKSLEDIEYALSIAVDNWDKVKKICKCGKLFIRNSDNINLDICDDCYTTEGRRGDG